MSRRAVTTQRHTPVLTLAATFLMLLSNLAFYGCKHNRHTADPHLQKMDEMLTAQLPPGTPQARVQYFIRSRGYQFEEAPDKDSLRALVRHVDSETLQPSLAHVTFRFDSSGKLVTFELQPTPEGPLRP